MIIIDDFAFGLLASAIVALATQRDQNLNEKQQAELNDLKEKIGRLRSAQAQGELLVSQTLRDEYSPNSPIAKVADTIAADIACGRELVEWFLEPDPSRFDKRRSALTAHLAKAAGCASETVEGFLNRLAERVNQHIPLAQYRTDKKLNLILVRLQDQTDIETLLQRNHTYLVQHIEELLNRDQVSALKPVRPEPRAPSETNNLLSGGLPTDEDMNEDIDFRRSKFGEVMAAVRQIDTFPSSMRFIADAQQGKTTFLKRVGWELAKADYPVVQLSPASEHEAYAHWVHSNTGTLSDRPLILLIDDPVRHKDNFVSQMLTLHNANTDVIVLIASRREDWPEDDFDRIPFIRIAQIIELNPNRTEAEELVAKLAHCGLIEIAEESKDELTAAIDKIPMTVKYFENVIRLASHDRFKPMPAIIEHKLQEALATAPADAFIELYGLVCVPGMVGLALPQSLAQLLISPDRDALARQFNDSLPKPAIRFEQDLMRCTHEVHAEAFMVGQDAQALLTRIVHTLPDHPEISTFVGRLLELLRQRGRERLAREAWQTVAESIGDEHWHDCDVDTLTGFWGSFFYETKHGALALRVNAIAVEKAPESAMAHHNYAVLLEQGGDRAGARAHYEEVLRINPEDADTHNNYGSLLKAEGDSAGARTHYEESLRINPESAAARNNYGSLLKAEGDSAGARTHYEESLRINPENAEAHNNYANLLRSEGDSTGARAHYEEAMRINPENAKALANYGSLCLYQDDVRGALDLIVRAICLKSLPHRGIRIVNWFQDRMEDMSTIIEAADEPTERRGAALAMYVALKGEEARPVVEKWQDDPSFAESAKTCNELLAILSEALPADSDEDDSE